MTIFLTRVFVFQRMKILVFYIEGYEYKFRWNSFWRTLNFETAQNKGYKCTPSYSRTVLYKCTIVLQEEYEV